MNPTRDAKNYVRGSSGWVRVDQVLIWNSLINQPELITFIRVTEKIPAYPKTAPAKVTPAKELEPSWQGVKNPFK
jgi:hypothetical protein